MPPTEKGTPPISPRTAADLGWVSVVMMARAARRAASASALSAAAASRTPAVSLSIGSGWPMMPVEATQTSSGRAADQPGDQLGRGAHVLHAPGAGAGVGVAGVGDDGAQAVGGQALLVPDHRGGGETVAGKDAGGRGRPVADDEGDVGLALGGLDAAAGGAGAEAGGGQDGAVEDAFHVRWALACGKRLNAPRRCAVSQAAGTGCNARARRRCRRASCRAARPGGSGGRRSRGSA